MTKHPASTAQPQPPSGAFTPAELTSTATPPMVLYGCVLMETEAGMKIRRQEVKPNYKHKHMTICSKAHTNTFSFQSASVKQLTYV